MADKMPHPFEGGNYCKRSRIDIFFFLMILALPFQGQGIEIGLPFTISLIFGILFLITHFSYLKPTKFDKQDILFFIFISFSGLSLAYNLILQPPSSIGEGLSASVLRGAIHLLRFVYLFFFYKTLKRFFIYSKRNIYKLYRRLFLVGLIPAVYGTYQLVGIQMNWPLLNINNLHYAGNLPFFVTNDIKIPRVFATFGEPKGYGMFLLMMIPLLLSYLLAYQRRGNCLGFRQKWQLSTFRWLLVLVLATHFFLSLSKGALLTLVIGSTMLFFLFGERFILVILFIGFMGNIIINKISVGLFLEEISETFMRYVGINTLPTGAGILNFIKAFDVACTRPLFGLGPGGFAFYVAEHGLKFVQSQLQGATSFASYLLANTGFVGTALFLIMLGSHIGLGFRSIRHLTTYQMRNTSLHILISFSIVSLVMVAILFMIQSGLNELYLWILLALISALSRCAKGESNMAFDKEKS